LLSAAGRERQSSPRPLYVHLELPRRRGRILESRWRTIRRLRTVPSRSRNSDASLALSTADGLAHATRWLHALEVGRLVRGPGVANNRVEVRTLEPPAQNLARAVVARDGRRRITGTTISEAYGEVDAGHLLHAGHDLSIGVA